MEKAPINFTELPFKFNPSDANVRYYYKDGKWSGGEVVESFEINLHIAAQCLHYGQLAFEGLKVFERPGGRAQTFRLEENAKRMIRSAEKLLMQPVPVELFKDAVWKCVNANRRFIPPHGSGASLYVRPLLIGTSIQLGVNPSEEFTFIVFISPVGPYYKGGLSAVNLIVEENIDRAAPNGTGDIKIAGNYAAGLRATIPAKKKGYSEVLYLDVKEKKYIDESGSSNFIAITKDNKYVTPKSPSILPSITNDSIMRIAADEGMTVERRPISRDELGDFAECGCVGTAAVITPVGSITDGEKKFTYGDGKSAGPVISKLYNKLYGIQTGTVQDPYGWTEIIPMEG